MKVSAYDVARKAGVSQSTVSRVLNNYPFIKEEKRKKVLEAIEELGFTRDEIARGLAQKRTNTIGLIVGDIVNPFFAESVGVMMKKASELGYDVVICNTNHKDNLLEKSIRTLVGKRVDGMVVASTNKHNPALTKLYESGYPVVLYNTCLEDKHINYVIPNNEHGAYQATEHLIKLGHEKIAFIAGPSIFYSMGERLKGYKRALQEFNISYNEEFVYKEQYSYEKVFEYTINILQSNNRPTSFFAISDQMALAVLDAVRTLNFEVPKDISIIGFDDIHIASNSHIGLTTVAQRKEEMAEIALEKLFSLIEKPEQPKPIEVVLEPQLIVRKTTGPVTR
ncbi:LacI family transcriptional regulator [Priestia megaterium]|uniref:LacI family DNA-binding transcriptional regulator n=1 Tax=Priestia megaterium TaxID=1404 RepID=UPI000BF74AD1|nr:LacI family DNA-binding transcriptional regulator [Priestia megaterium]PFI59206.1 LacI family transcriptional regulator [Priestia megaterium]